MAEDLSMWSYWRDKRGSSVDAVESDFTETLKGDPYLLYLVNQAKATEAAINQYMERLEDGND